MAGIVLLSFFSCDLNTAGDARDIASGSAATRAASDFAGSSVCGVAGKMAGVDGADSSWRHRGAVGVAGSGASVGADVKAVSRPADEIAGSVAGNATDEEVGESAGEDASGVAIGAAVKAPSSAADKVAGGAVGKALRERATRDSLAGSIETDCTADEAASSCVIV